MHSFHNHSQASYPFIKRIESPSLAYLLQAYPLLTSLSFVLPPQIHSDR